MATARAEAELLDLGGNVPLKRWGALWTSLTLNSREIGTTGFPPGTGSPHAPQNASVLSTFPSQLLHLGIVSRLHGC